LKMFTNFMFSYTFFSLQSLCDDVWNC
jgi:hypothetical protein